LSQFFSSPHQSFTESSSPSRSLNYFQKPNEQQSSDKWVGFDGSQHTPGINVPEPHSRDDAPRIEDRDGEGDVDIGE
jgi:hypothetical protein